MKQKKKLFVLLGLHIMLMFFSMSGIASKLAAGEKFLSPKFILYYAVIIGLLGVYAIVWQQIIKRLPLTTAYANRAVTIVWGIIWGVLFFHENVTPLKIVGAVIVILGVVLFATADEGEEEASDGSKS
ncbi:MAG: EamA family transporter [Lachnospiraceae bacterium]|nr:EamA family transporter [Lachnospiraceae bacterium]MCR5212401.1 EamA family transporter [Lachnospiraceae bacterium]